MESVSLGTAVQVFLYALVTALATGLGAIPFAFVRTLSPRTIGRANALAAGLMLGASLGLLGEGVRHGGLETFIGANVGILFILVTERLLGEHEPSFGSFGGLDARRMLLMVVVMTVHSFAEGVAIGVSFGAGAAVATAITLALTIHNIPEGLAITAVLRPRGVSLAACAGWSVFSSLPQPLMAVPAYLLVAHFAAVLPYGLGFAAGAMVYMVLIELLPEAYEAARGREVAMVVGLTTVGMLVFQHYV
ncbi:MAG TPA: ZIP family metal transporter [Gemmatimonadaceae bacterium]|nr:ZIP family metal transporter [Gemmatimonadaceae bacterium]